MPLITKPNYNQIFASQAPDIDKPAVFNNYPEGWGPESRPNNGKPTVKGFNFLQQTSDLKDLWILQNGACLPYDESIEYAEGAPVLKDGVIQYKTADGFSPAISEKPYILNYFSEGTSYPLNARVTLENGDIVRSTIANNTVDPNADMTGWYNFEGEQDVINDATIQKVASIADLIAYNPRKNTQVVNVLSYHPDKNVGGDLFMWRSDLSKSLHDGGYVIDPLIAMPALAEFNTYYAPQNTGTGVWVRLNNKQDVHAEEYGIVKLTDNATAVWACAAIQQAVKRASVNSTTDYHCKTARVSKGRYYTTNPIVLTQNGTFSARLPSLIGGNGNNIFDVELIKTTQNTVGAGYAGGDKDAVIYVSAGTGAGKSLYVYGEHTSGFALSRTTIDVGYGYFAQDSVMGYRGNIQAQDHAHNIWTDNCWMSKLGFLRAFKGLKGIAIRGGTSNFGGPLYSDSCKHGGYDFYGLSYSELQSACDGCGYALPNGGIAYDFSFAKGVKGTFAVERHKGTEFYFHYSDGVKIAGRSYHTTPVQDSAYKVQVNGGSVYSFDNYTWKETFANTSEMTAAQIAKYTFTNKVPTNNSSTNFKDCEFNDNFAKSGFVAQLDGKFAANVLDAAYNSQAGVVSHLISINNTAFKRLCYMGQSGVVELLSANAISPTYGDRFYCNPFTLTEGTPNTIANPKPNRIAKSAISTNQASPTILWYLSQGGAITGAHLRGYIDADGWLCVQHNVSGNSIDYRFVLAV